MKRKKGINDNNNHHEKRIRLQNSAMPTNIVVSPVVFKVVSKLVVLVTKNASHMDIPLPLSVIWNVLTKYSLTMSAKHPFAMRYATNGNKGRMIPTNPQATVLAQRLFSATMTTTIAMPPIIIKRFHLTSRHHAMLTPSQKAYFFNSVSDGCWSEREVQ